MRTSLPVLDALAWAGAAVLAGCGGSSSPSGADAGVSGEAYFGLQKGRCFEYTSHDTIQAVPDLGVVVEDIVTNDSSCSLPTYKVSYRTWHVAMNDYIALNGESMVLCRREFPGGKTYVYSPPMQRLVMPVVSGATLRATSQTTVYDGAGSSGTEAHDLRVDVFPTAALPLPIGQTVSANQLLFTETNMRLEKRHFVAGTGATDAADGFVRVEFNFELDDSQPSVAYTLQKVRDLGDNPTQANPLCGMAP